VLNARAAQAPEWTSCCCGNKVVPVPLVQAEKSPLSNPSLNRRDETAVEVLVAGGVGVFVETGKGVFVGVAAAVVYWSPKVRMCWSELVWLLE
jgi:hypothetical protein